MVDFVHFDFQLGLTTWRRFILAENINFIHKSIDYKILHSKLFFGFELLIPTAIISFIYPNWRFIRKLTYICCLLIIKPIKSDTICDTYVFTLKMFSGCVSILSKYLRCALLVRNISASVLAQHNTIFSCLFTYILIRC